MHHQASMVAPIACVALFPPNFCRPAAPQEKLVPMHTQGQSTRKLTSGVTTGAQKQQDTPEQGSAGTVCARRHRHPKNGATHTHALSRLPSTAWPAARCCAPPPPQSPLPRRRSPARCYRTGPPPAGTRQSPPGGQTWGGVPGGVCVCVCVPPCVLRESTGRNSTGRRISW